MLFPDDSRFPEQASLITIGRWMKHVALESIVGGADIVEKFFADIDIENVFPVRHFRQRFIHNGAIAANWVIGADAWKNREDKDLCGRKAFSQIGKYGTLADNCSGWSIGSEIVGANQQLNDFGLIPLAFPILHAPQHVLRAVISNGKHGCTVLGVVILLSCVLSPKSERDPLKRISRCNCPLLCGKEVKLPRSVRGRLGE